MRLAKESLLPGEKCIDLKFYEREFFRSTLTGITTPRSSIIFPQKKLHFFKDNAGNKELEHGGRRRSWLSITR